MPLAQDLRGQPPGGKGGFDDSYKTIRVRIFPIMSVPSSQDPYPVSANRDEVYLFNSGGFTVTDLQNPKRAVVGERVYMNAKKGVVLVDAITLKLTTMDIKPNDTSITTTVRWNGSGVKLEYRGNFRIEETLHRVVDRWTGKEEFSATLWSVMNYVSVEDYLYAVVPSEMPTSFEPEAHKAQAIAARTYAVFHMWLARTVENRNWDVDPTTWFQSYRGALVENKKLIPAVQATEGQVLTYKDRIIEAFFSANSGGTLCSVSECFGFPDRPYIVSKPDVAGIREKWGGTWSASITKSGIDARLLKMESEGKIVIADLIKNYRGPQDIEGVEPLDVGAAGRVQTLTLVMRDKRRIALSKEVSREIRWQFKMATNFYSLSSIVKGQAQDVEGHGMGHGVGLCQYGAQIMAQGGSTYEQILKFYYEGVEITDL